MIGRKRPSIMPAHMHTIAGKAIAVPMSDVEDLTLDCEGINDNDMYAVRGEKWMSGLHKEWSAEPRRDVQEAYLVR